MREVFAVSSPDGRYELTLCADRIRVGRVFPPRPSGRISKKTVCQELPLFKLKAIHCWEGMFGFEMRSREDFRLVGELAGFRQNIEEHELRAFAEKTNAFLSGRPRWWLYSSWLYHEKFLHSRLYFLLLALRDHGRWLRDDVLFRRR